LKHFLIFIFAGLVLIGCALGILSGCGGSTVDETPSPNGSSELETRNPAEAPDLDHQLSEFSELGIALNAGITKDDLLYSFEADAYRDDPYFLLLFMMGTEVEREPWGRRVSDRVWNFDLEAIEGDGDYVQIIENFERLTGRRDLFEDVSDKLDYGARIARVSYVLGGREVHKELRFEDDWADPFFVAELAEDIESTIGDGRRFWAADNGQASVLIFCNEETAKALNALRPGLVLPYT
tara:strand:- start:496 stop:1209 length:714 start_codon:yes stop_codon:yes gene_type:complete